MRFSNEAKLALDQMLPCSCKEGPKGVKLVLNNLTAFQNKAQEIKFCTIMHYKITRCAKKQENIVHTEENNK